MCKKTVAIIVGIVAFLAAAGAAAYAIYCFIEKKKQCDDFECDNYCECPCEPEEAVEAVEEAVEAIAEEAKDE